MSRKSRWREKAIVERMIRLRTMEDDQMSTVVADVVRCGGEELVLITL